MKKIERKYLVRGILVLLVLVGIFDLGYFHIGLFSETDYLVSVTAENGATIVKGQQGSCFELTMEGADHIVFFSDRPEREAMRVSPGDLLTVWEEEFVGNPPNADLQLFDRDRGDELAIVTLESTPVWDEATQSLTFERACLVSLVSDNSFKEDDLTIASDLEEVLSGRFEKGALFIDSVVGRFARDTGKGTHTIPEGAETLKIPKEAKTSGEVFPDIGEKEKEINLKILLDNADHDDWEQYAYKQEGGIIRSSAKEVGEIGVREGGEQANAPAERVGARLGEATVSELSKAALLNEKEGFVEDVGISALYSDIRGNLLSVADDTRLSYALANRIIEGQRKAVGNSVVKFLTDLGLEYGKISFCGEAISVGAADNLKEKTINYLEIIIEGRIFNDLKNGMSIREIESDISKNLQHDIELAVLHSLLDIKDKCPMVTEDDLYTFIHNRLMVAEGAVPGRFDDVYSGATQILQQHFHNIAKDINWEEFGGMLANYQRIEEQGDFSSFKTHLQPMTQVSSYSVLHGATVEFDLLAAQGNDFYGKGLVSDFDITVIEEMVDGVLEDIIEDAAEDLADVLE